MASFNSIEIRPCFINGEKALFHLWVKKYDIFKNEYFNGLVEYENGIVEEISADLIRFCDHKTREYSFEESE